MVNTSKQNDIQFTWQSIFWRLVVTILLLLALAGFGATILGQLTAQPNAQVLPPLPQQVEIGR
jgi:hypothetical protein